LQWRLAAPRTKAKLGQGARTEKGSCYSLRQDFPGAASGAVDLTGMVGRHPIDRGTLLIKIENF
jgi:hypothetical protein